MPITPETSAGQADQLTPRASDTLLTLIQNYAIAYERGVGDVIDLLEDAIGLRLSRLEDAGTFGTMSPQAHATVLDMVLGDVSRPDPRPTLAPGALVANVCTCVPRPLTADQHASMCIHRDATDRR